MLWKTPVALSRSFGAALALLKPLIAVGFESSIQTQWLQHGRICRSAGKASAGGPLKSISCPVPDCSERGSLDDTEKELERTLADAAKYINKTYDVEGLHSSFPERLEKLRKRRGTRLTEH